MNLIYKNYGLIFFIILISVSIYLVLSMQIPLIGTFGGKSLEEGVSYNFISIILNWQEHEFLRNRLTQIFIVEQIEAIDLKTLTNEYVPDQISEEFDLRFWKRSAYVSYQPGFLYIIYLLCEIFNFDNRSEIKFFTDCLLICISLIIPTLLSIISFKISAKFNCEKNFKFLIASFIFISFYVNQFSIKQFTGVFSPENFEVLYLTLFIYLRINIIKSEQIDKNFVILIGIIFIWSLTSHLIFILIILDFLLNLKNFNKLKKYFFFAFLITFIGGVIFLVNLYILDMNDYGFKKFIGRINDVKSTTGSSHSMFFTMIDNDGEYYYPNVFKSYEWLQLHPIIEKPFIFLVLGILIILYLIKKKLNFDFYNLYVVPLLCSMTYSIVFVDHFAKHPMLQHKFLIFTSLSYLIMISYVSNLVLNYRNKLNIFYKKQSVINFLFFIFILLYYAYKISRYKIFNY